MQRTGWSGNVTDSNTMEMNHPVYPKTLQWFFPLPPLQWWSVAIVMIPEMASFLNNELLPCQPASCTCIVMLSSKGTEDAIGKASDGSSCTLPASLKPPGCKAQARHKCPKWTWIWECRESCKFVFPVSETQMLDDVKHGIRAQWKEYGLPWWKLWLRLEWLLVFPPFQCLVPELGNVKIHFLQIWNGFPLGKQNLHETSIDETQPCFKQYCWAFTRPG